MRDEEEIRDLLDETLDDNRLHYDDANVQTNSTLALIQTSLKAKRDVLQWVLEDG